MPKVIALVPVIVALAVGIASGADDPRGHASVSNTITILASDLIHPSRLTMRSGDVLEFDNYSAHTMMLVFTEPRDQTAKVRCRVADSGAAARDAAAWQLDDFRSDPQLSATIPPGRSASPCSLEPGRYAFVMKQMARDVRAPRETLGTTGIIAVQQ